MCVRYLLTTQEKKDFLAKIFRNFLSKYKYFIWMCTYVKKDLPPKPNQNKTQTQKFSSVCPIMPRRED